MGREDLSGKGIGEACLLQASGTGGWKTALPLAGVVAEIAPDVSHEYVDGVRHVGDRAWILFLVRHLDSAPGVVEQFVAVDLDVVNELLVVRRLVMDEVSRHLGSNRSR